MGSLFRMLNTYLLKYTPSEMKPCNQFKEEVRALGDTIGPMFIYCLMWSIGGQVTGDERIKFSDYVWATLNSDCREKLEKNDWLHGAEVAPMQDIQMKGVEPGQNLYDFCYDTEKKMWVPWMETQIQQLKKLQKLLQSESETELTHLAHSYGESQYQPNLFLKRIQN